MDNKKANISQIRKYLNGQLDATAMHKLEREALDDPFLMDALEGYEAAGKDQQPNIAELNERLQQRTQERKGRVIAWRAWSIAASVLLVLTIGGLWMRKTPSSSPVLERQTADVALYKKSQKVLKDTISLQKPVIPAAPVLAQFNKKPAALKQVKPGEKSVYQQEISAADNATPATGNVGGAPPVIAETKAEYDKNTSMLSEAVVNNYTQNKKVVADTTMLTFGSTTPPKTYGNFKNSTITSKLQGRVEGLKIEPTDPKTHSAIDLARYAGVIISKDDGMPLIGAAIRVKGTNRSTVTDTKGYFALPATAPGDKETLDIAYIGYQNTQVSAKAGDSLKVALKPYEGSLSEVVIVKGDESVYVAAHPEKGWSDLKKYLQTNATLPDGTTGTVSVTFTVNADGSLSDMKVKKSLNTIADQKAMELLKTGPDWISNTKHTPETVTVKIKFQKQK
ncbi:TonB family C-terminal domain-containing protein [Mucilaginibacter pineti]|uniref:TonB family C-terminal domain-containing protein n=1 Tax=Mucilaginibacter pineti TaxID=1391627 RepID=A0A1G7AL95_9SPHI|nr:carboxypeptidase-like regulatory domain-containing protein [Mucilaginibacter pineti]SDE14765.1 TonB family C-terminal domain-containing protein [Mucilaginibacter pineti]